LMAVVGVVGVVATFWFGFHPFVSKTLQQTLRTTSYLLRKQSKRKSNQSFRY
jgi:hypothetical protein